MQEDYQFILPVAKNSGFKARRENQASELCRQATFLSVVGSEHYINDGSASQQDIQNELRVEYGRIGGRDEENLFRSSHSSHVAGRNLNKRAEGGRIHIQGSGVSIDRARS